MKSFLQYAALVGIFVLGVLGILRLGHSLQAPASVGGNWTLQLTLPPGLDPACTLALPGTDSAVLEISQSGPELVLTLNDANQTTFSGQLAGLKINASSKQEPGWQLEADVDRQPEPDRLVGTLASGSCAASIQVVGIRQPHSTSLTGQH